MILNYILDSNGNPVPEPDLNKWARWFGTADRHLGDTVVAHGDDGQSIRVSTVFLGSDHSFGVGTPVLYETMIFGGVHDQEQWRYRTADEARRGHEHACRIAAGGDPC